MHGVWSSVLLTLALLGAASCLPLSAEQSLTEVAASDDQLLNELDGAALAEVNDKQDDRAEVDASIVALDYEEAASSHIEEQLEARRDQIYAALDSIRRRRSLNDEKVRDEKKIRYYKRIENHGEHLHDELRRLRRRPIEDPEPAECVHNEPAEWHEHERHAAKPTYLSHRRRRADGQDSRGSSEEHSDKHNKTEGSSEEQKRAHAHSRTRREASNSSSEEQGEKKIKSDSSASSEEQPKLQQQTAQTEPAPTQQVAAEGVPATRRRRHSDDNEDHNILRHDAKSSIEAKAEGDIDYDAIEAIPDQLKTSIEDYVQGCEVMEVNSKEANETTYVE